MTAKLFQSFQQALRERKAYTLPPATVDDIRRCEQRLGVRLPPEMREYFLQMNGTDGMDNELIYFWPLDELTSEKLTDDSACLVFGDWSICAGRYGMALAPDPWGEHSIVALGRPAAPHRLASGLPQFIEKYIGDPLSLVVY